MIRKNNVLCAALVALVALSVAAFRPMAAAAQNAEESAGARVESRYGMGQESQAPEGLPAQSVEQAIDKVQTPAFVQEGRTFNLEDNADFPEKGEGTFDLEQSVSRALFANPQMESARRVISGAEQGRRQALANFGPVGTVTYGYQRTDAQVFGSSSLSVTDPTNPSNTTSMPTRTKTGYWSNLYSLQLQATQPIFTGFKLLSSYQQTQLAKDQADAQMNYTELTLIKSVQKAFLALLQARSNVKSNQDSVARLESQYKVTQAFYDVGLKPRLDVLQAEAELAKAEQKLLKAQNTVLTQTAQLNSLLNLPLNQNTGYVGELTYVPFSMNIQQCLDEAYKERPDLLIGVKSVQIAGKSENIAASGLYPQIQAQATYTRQGDHADLTNDRKSASVAPESTTLGVTAQWQVWDWGSTFFGYRQASENTKKIMADLAKLRLDVGYEVKTYHLNIQDAAKRISVARTGLEAAKEGYRMAVARYQAQVGTNTDVLDAQARVSEAEFSLTQALSDYQGSLADIYVAMGRKNLSLAPQ